MTNFDQNENMKIVDMLKLNFNPRDTSDVGDQ